MPVYSPFLNLLVQCGLATILVSGAVLARQRCFRTHGWVQSTVVLVNLAAILGFMLPSFSRQLAPHWRLTLHGAGDWIVLAHAAVGGIAELLAIYVILVAGSSLLPERYRFSRYKPWMRTTLALWLMALLLGFATYRVCYAQSAAPPAAGQDSKNVVVTISNFKFDPKEVKVKAGTVVTWTDSGGRHTVKSDDGSFDSGTLTAGGSYQHKFEKPGVYPYYCMFHGERGGKDMAGVVTVEPR
jgi:plastocyanin